MTATTVEAFDDVAAWRARRANNTASTEISITLDGLPRSRRSPARPTASIVASANAGTHRVERNGAAVDLTDSDDLTLWVRGEERADGSAEHPFFAQLRLGSAALAPDADGNGWRRSIPVLNPKAWEYVPLSLNDLVPQVRGAVTKVWVESLGSNPWKLGLDSILGVHDEVL